MKHLLLLACAMPLVAMDNAVIPTSSKLGALSVINKNGRLDYSIADRSVQRCDVYGPLKEISSEEQLSGFLANGGRIKVSQMSNGEYVLRSGVDIKGGGPITGWIAGWAATSAGYGVPAAIATGATVATGGAALAAIPSAAITTATLTGTGIAVGGGLSTAAGVSAIATAGGAAAGAAATASVASGIAISTAVVSTGAATVVGASVAAGGVTIATGTATVLGAAGTQVVAAGTAAGTLATYGAAVESVAAATQVAVTLIPWLP